MSFDYNKRLEKVRERIDVANIDALIVSEPHNIFYLSGSNGGYTGAKISLIVSRNKSILIIDPRYITEAKQSAKADRFVTWINPGYSDLAEILKELGIKRVGFEATNVTVKQYERMITDFDEIELVAVSGIVEPIREVKDEDEIKKIKEAAKIGDRAFDYIIDFIRPGISELEIATEIDYFMRKNGAEKPSFDTIVASGLNSAVPHATPSNRKIKKGDFITLDFGAVVDGYHSDMTRTVVIGKADEKQREIYSIVKKAQLLALEALSAGRVCKDIDFTAREFIESHGYGEYFVHNLGHGVGLQIHEMPTLGKSVETVLLPNMVVTVEPGIYIEGFGGVRIEDLVVVEKTGYKLLNHSTKDLLEL